MNLQHVFEQTEIKVAPGGFEFRSPRHEEIMRNKRMITSIRLDIPKAIFPSSIISLHNIPAGYVYPDLETAKRNAHLHMPGCVIRYEIPMKPMGILDRICTAIGKIFGGG
jgi:hypothetical protein